MYLFKAIILKHKNSRVWPENEYSHKVIHNLSSNKYKDTYTYKQEYN